MKLIIRSAAHGLYDIEVDGLRVGHIINERDDCGRRNGRRVARLYTHPGRPDIKAGLMSRLRLRDLRADLREHLRENGPWWTSPPETR